MSQKKTLVAKGWPRLFLMKAEATSSNSVRRRSRWISRSSRRCTTSKKMTREYDLDLAFMVKCSSEELSRWMTSTLDLPCIFTSSSSNSHLPLTAHAINIVNANPSTTKMPITSFAITCCPLPSRPHVTFLFLEYTWKLEVVDRWPLLLIDFFPPHSMPF